ncbi:MAG: DUF3109 family protein [Saprospiraceae bacterium]
MILIGDILVSEQLVENRFVCNLSACKGACCWEGDLGAPVDADEAQILEQIYPILEPMLGIESREIIAREGTAMYYKELEGLGTPLLDNGACVYLNFEPDGTGKCAIEKAYESGAVDFKKPISCHLYPVRVIENPQTRFVALNYDEWEICSAACALGAQLQVPVYQFVRDALVRKFGEDFYEELDAAAAHLSGL